MNDISQSGQMPNVVNLEVGEGVNDTCECELQTSKNVIYSVLEVEAETKAGPRPSFAPT